MSKEKSRINIGDIVQVDFNVSRSTLSRKAEVVHIPAATGDGWTFNCLDTGNTYFVSEGCTITKMAEKP